MNSAGARAFDRSNDPTGRPDFERHRLSIDVAQRVEAEGVQAQVQRHQDRFLAFEVVVDRRLENPNCSAISRSDVFSLALRGEEFEGDIEDALTSAGTVGR